MFRIYYFKLGFDVHVEIDALSIISGEAMKNCLHFTSTTALYTKQVRVVAKEEQHKLFNPQTDLDLKRPWVTFRMF